MLTEKQWYDAVKKHAEKEAIDLESGFRVWVLSEAGTRVAQSNAEGIDSFDNQGDAYTCAKRHTNTRLVMVTGPKGRFDLLATEDRFPY